MTSIVHLLPASPFGGMQRIVVALSSEQARRGAKVRILFTNYSEVTTLLAASEGVLHTAPNKNASIVQRLLHLSQNLITLQPDLIHLHMPPPWLVPIVLMMGKPLVCHLHVRAPRKGGLTKLSYSVLLRRKPELIAVSEWISQDWTSVYRLDRSQVHVIYNGVYAHFGPDRSPPRRRQIRFGIAGRIAHGKGFEQLQEIGQALHDLDPFCRILVAGDGPERLRLQAAISRAGLEGVIEFCGFVADMTTFWSVLDCAFFLSNEEPFGLAMLEPVTHGIPTVAFRNGTGSDEVAEKCRGVVLVDNGNIEAFAIAALDLVRDDAARAHAVAVGQRDIQEHFNVGRMERQVTERYGPFLSGTVGGSIGSVHRK